MRNSRDRILTSHAGSLPRTDELLGLNKERFESGQTGESFSQGLRAATESVVRRQGEAGVDVPNDGEYGKSMRDTVDYAAWVNYARERLGGLTFSPGPPTAGGSISITSTTFNTRRDRALFQEAYTDPTSYITLGPTGRMAVTASGPVTYVGHELLEADIDNLKSALAAAGVEEGFMTSVAPGSAARMATTYYASEEDLIFACADAMREEYQAIVESGLILQLDDPAIAENWDRLNPEPTVEEYRKYSMVRVEALNHAIRGLPEDRIRFHLCWGSWHGPHVTDIAMEDIIDVMLAINAQAYSFEAGNVRHEHEWKVWQERKLADGKILIPGVVSHATNVIEHPELVADRIVRFAEIVGRENVIAGTDCGLGGRVHPQIAWAKLQTLSEGATLASQRLWS